jgi:hypothetical protein
MGRVWDTENRGKGSSGGGQRAVVVEVVVAPPNSAYIAAMMSLFSVLPVSPFAAGPGLRLSLLRLARS